MLIAEEKLFRKTETSIPSTTYATHGIFRYPAKFIPHIVRYVLKKYVREGGWVIDPFAGYGTVAIESHLIGRNYYLCDINPITEVIVKASTYIGETPLDKLLINFSYDEEFLPKWSNLEYWFPREFLEILARAWGYWHYEIDERYKPVAALPLLLTTRYFSYSDERISKLFKSSYSKDKVQKLLQKYRGERLRDAIEQTYVKNLKHTLNKIREYNKLRPKQVEGIIHTGVDLLEYKPVRKVETLLTSPPYLQSQEYIRSTKMELFWLGYPEEFIRGLSKKEIPYNNYQGYEIKSQTYYKFLHSYVEKLGSKNLEKIYKTYFSSLGKILEKLVDYVEDYLSLVVGNSKMRSTMVPINEIVSEHLEALGLRPVEVVRDRIVSRRMFNPRFNPATKLIESRIPNEYLLVFKK